jgi:hypothetical protein
MKTRIGASLSGQVSIFEGCLSGRAQITHRGMGHGLGMKSPTFRRYSSAGTDWAAWVIDRHSGGAWGVGPALLN